jgi:hypothetical protein
MPPDSIGRQEGRVGTVERRAYGNKSGRWKTHRPETEGTQSSTDKETLMKNMPKKCGPQAPQSAFPTTHNYAGGALWRGKTGRAAHSATRASRAKMAGEEASAAGMPGKVPEV